MIKSLFAVIIGGSVGCTLRWLLSTRFNSLFPNLPPEPPRESWRLNFLRKR